MAYEPTNWKSGDVITSAKLNKIENGLAASGGAGFMTFDVVEESGEETYEVQGTAGTVFEAMKTSVVAFVQKYNGEIFDIELVCHADEDAGQYVFHTTTKIYSANDATEKPMHNGGK